MRRDDSKGEKSARSSLAQKVFFGRGGEWCLIND